MEFVGGEGGEWGAWGEWGVGETRASLHAWNIYACLFGKIWVAPVQSSRGHLAMFSIQYCVVWKLTCGYSDHTATYRNYN